MNTGQPLSSFCAVQISYRGFSVDGCTVTVVVAYCSTSSRNMTYVFSGMFTGARDEASRVYVAFLVRMRLPGLPSVSFETV